nr:hypothetical protein [Synechococcus sp. CS-1325]
MGFDAGADLGLTIQAAVAEAGRDQHHPGGHTQLVGACLQHHLPVRVRTCGGSAQDSPGARQHLGACGNSRFQQRLIEAGPGEDPASLHNDRAHQASHPELQHPQGKATLLCHQLREPGGLKGCQGLGAEAGPADFPAGEAALLHQQHPHPAPGEAMGRQGAGRSSPNHHHIPAGRDLQRQRIRRWGHRGSRRAGSARARSG